MRICNGLIATAAVAVGLLALPASPALAATPNFGSHVRVCAQEMGFSGSLNPGVMHQGAAGWDAHQNH